MKIKFLAGLLGLALMQSQFGGPGQSTVLKISGVCVSSASPAVCGNATSGFATVAAGTTTVTVNTTAIAANSIIETQEDSSVGSLLGVTCNTALNSIEPTTRVVGTSFTITTNNPVTNPECFSFVIINPNQ